MQRIIFFDGICGLCDRFVIFVFEHDKKRFFKYAALQSKSATQMLGSQDLKLNTIVYAEDDKIYYKSAAVLRIMFHLGGLFKLFSISATIIPNQIRDFIYTKIANNRYKLFGQSDVCRLPSPEEKNYFLD